MSGTSPGRGDIVWAFTTFQPEPPFELLGIDGVKRSYATAVDVAKAVRDKELADTPTFSTAAKNRPVVLLQDRPLKALPEYAALKLTRFTKLSPAEQQNVRDGKLSSLFYLPHNEAKYGLKQENAIDLNSLVRIHESAIVIPKPIGSLDANEIDVLGRRLAKFLDIDLEPAIKAGIKERWQALVDAQKA